MESKLAEQEDAIIAEPPTFNKAKRAFEKANVAWTKACKERDDTNEAITAKKKELTDLENQSRPRGGACCGAPVPAAAAKAFWRHRERRASHSRLDPAPRAFVSRGRSRRTSRRMAFPKP